jgi:hypothetical protein
MPIIASPSTVQNYDCHDSLGKRYYCKLLDAKYTKASDKQNYTAGEHTKQMYSDMKSLHSDRQQDVMLQILGRKQQNSLLYIQWYPSA